MAATAFCKPSDNIQRMGTRYYFRQVVPYDLRHRIHQHEFRYSLRTGDRRLAKQRASFLYAKLWALFTSLRKGDKSMENMTAEQIKMLVAEWLYEALESDERQLATTGHIFRFKDEYGNETTAQDHAESYSFLATDRAEQLVNCNYRAVQQDVDQLLIDRRIPFTRDTEEYGLLCREMLIAQRLYFDILSERVTGNYNSKYEAQRRANYSVRPLRAERVTPKDKDTEKPLSFFVDKYLGECESKNKWVPRSLIENSNRLKFLVTATGDCKLGDITIDTLREALALLYKMPRNWVNSAKYKTWTIEQIREADIPKEDRLAWKSVNNYCDTINAFLSWVKTFHNGALWLDAVFEPTKRNKHEAKHSRVAAFTDEDLHKIFSLYMSDWYLGNPRRRSEFVSNRCWYWLPLIMLYTGARPEEIAQLYLSDFKLVEGLQCVEITELNEDGEEAADKNVKNTSSIRLVPLHKQLLDFGLWELVEAMRKAGKQRLFEELELSSDGRYSKGYGQQFNRFLIDIGVKNKEEEKQKKSRIKTFNSFRHTFLTYCARHRLDIKHREKAVGHKTKEYEISDINYIEETAYVGNTLELVINQIDYGIDLSHLKGHRHTKL